MNNYYYLSITESKHSIVFIDHLEFDSKKITEQDLILNKFDSSTILHGVVSSGNYYPDIILYGTSFLPIVSSGLFELLSQFLNGTKIIIADRTYFFLHYPNVIECIDYNKSVFQEFEIPISGVLKKIKNFYKVSLDVSKLSSNYFRVKEYETFPFISSQIHKIIEGWDLSGIILKMVN